MTTGTEELAFDQVGFLYDHAQGELIAGSSLALLVMVVAGTALHPAVALGWLCSALVIYIGRCLVSQRYSGASSDVDVNNKWKAIVIAGTTATGLCSGALGVFATLPTLNAASGFTLFCIVCLAGSMVAVYAGLYSAVLAFGVPALLPDALYLAVTGTPAEMLAGGMLCVVAALLLLGSVPIRRTALQLFSIKREHEDLQTEFEVVRHETAQLKLTLKNSTKRREQAEVDLADTTGELDTLRLRASTLQKTIERVSPMCPVTGLANEKAFTSALENEWRRSLRSKVAISLIAIRIDKLDVYRGEFGEDGATAVLKCAAKLLRGFARQAEDSAACLDDDRFVLLLLGSDTRNTVRMAEVLRRRISLEKNPLGNGTRAAYVGTATMAPLEEQTQRGTAAAS